MTTHLQQTHLAFTVIVFSSLLALASTATPEDILSINDADIDPLNNEVVDLSNNVFLKHMISSRATGFEGPQYLPPKCERNEYCVTKSLCKNGYFTGQIPNSQAACDTEKGEVCCKYQAPVTQPPPTTPRPTTPRPTPPPGIPCQDDNYDCVPRSQCINGEIKSIYQKKQTTCNAATEICCRFPTMILEQDGYHLKVPKEGLTLPPRETPRPTTPQTPRVTQRITTKPPTYLPPPAEESKPQIKVVTTPRPILTTKQMRGESELSLPIVPKGGIQSNTIGKGELDTSIYKNKPGGNIQSNTIGKGDQDTASFNIPLPTACAAAMNCTDIKFCNATGYISTTPVEMSPSEEAFRVPLSDCRDPTKGLEAGKCCRDPDYVDPWPSSTFKPRERRKSDETLPTSKPQKRTADLYTTTGSLPVQRSIASTFACKTAQRRYDTEPRGRESIDANFKEFTWQIMVLKDSTKTLICGGSLIAPNVVLTSATCLKNQKPFDTVLKAGEWQLGSDIEPLKFDIKRASSIHLHPRYNPQTQENDMAVVFVEAKFKYGGPIDHVSPICLDESDISADEKCVTLGWGETALAYHLQDAIMHYTNVQPSANVYDPNSRNHIGNTEIDTSLVDPGSALACSRDQVSYYLKGIYTRKIGTNEIEFTRPDLTWINGLLYGSRFRG